MKGGREDAQFIQREQAIVEEHTEKFLEDQGAGAPCSCNELRDRLYEFLDRELEDSDCARLERHVGECVECNAAADAEAHIRQLLRRSCAEQAPQDLRARVVAQLTVLRSVSVTTIQQRQVRG